MSRLRITCVGDPVERKEFVPGFPVVLSRAAYWADLELELVDDEGNAHAITNVERVEWIAEQGTEAARAIVHFIDVDARVEVDGQRLTMVDARVSRVRAWVEKQIVEGNDHGAIEELAEIVGGAP